MIVSVLSYSIRAGKPSNEAQESESVIDLDVRALKGPIKSLRDKGKTGANRDVVDDIMKRKDNEDTLTQLKSVVQELADASEKFILHVGCERGIHRSVVFAKWVAEAFNVSTVEHRDLNIHTNCKHGQKKHGRDARGKERDKKEQYRNGGLFH